MMYYVDADGNHPGQPSYAPQSYGQVDQLLWTSAPLPTIYAWTQMDGPESGVYLLAIFFAADPSVDYASVHCTMNREDDNMYWTGSQWVSVSSGSKPELAGDPDPLNTYHHNDWKATSPMPTGSNPDP
jgi:hypothetical protein